MKFLITSFDSGVHIIPSIPFSLNEKDTLYTDPLPLGVFYPEVDTTSSIKDIKPPINTPLNFAELLPFIGIGFGAIILAGLIIYLYLRFRKKKPLFTKQPQDLPAHLIAFAELDRLKNDKLWEKGKVKEFYIRLSDIIRRYLENRYTFRAMESVTDEILLDFRKVNQEDDVKEMLTGILQTSDMVKFAKWDPQPAENQLNLDNGYFFVEKTRYLEVPRTEELSETISGLADAERKEAGS
jgi:hypothetical protein